MRFIDFSLSFSNHSLTLGFLDFGYAIKSEIQKTDLNAREILAFDLLILFLFCPEQEQQQSGKRGHDLI